MGRSIRIGKLFGIPIGINYTWFLIFGMVTFFLATAYFPARYPNWSPALRWAVGLATSLLFFASVVGHELAHSLVARASGIPVKSITLFIFGGVATISREASKPLTELIMAAAGPVSSLLIAAFFGLVWLVGRGISEPVAALGSYLAEINLILAVFNLIPGFPLDGGRIFRALAWALTGNFSGATRIASWVGQVIAVLMIFGGLVIAFQGDWGNGLWLAFIGWFLDNAAVQTYRQTMLREALRGLTAGDVMDCNCPQVDDATSLDELVHNHILRQSRRCFLITDGGRLRGMVTMHNIKGVPKDRWATTTVAQVMTPFDGLKTVDVHEEANRVLELMDEEDINQMPVVDGGQLVGLIGRDNLLHFIRTRAELGI